MKKKERPRRCLCVWIIFGFWVLGTATSGSRVVLGQGERPGPVQGAGPGSIEFAAEPVMIDSMGMRLFLPVGSSIQTRFIRGGQSRSLIQPDDQRWVMYVENKVSESDLTPMQILEGVIRIHQEPFVIEDRQGEKRSAIEVLDRTDDLKIVGLSAARAYIGQPRDASYPVTGYMILRIDPRHYVVFQFTTPLGNYDDTRTVFEAIAATTSFPNRTETLEARLDSIEMGREFLGGLSGEEFEGVLEEESTFIRVYRPSATGAPSDATEIGYQKITARKGQLGELDPDKPRSRWNLQEREFGFLVRLDARVLISDVVMDTRGLFFLSRDRENEMWSIVIEEKGRDEFDRVRVNRATQTLARRGGELRVQTVRPGATPDEKVYEVLLDHYLSAVERYLLPALVALRAGERTERLDLAFYNFDPQRSVVTLRREVFERTPEGGWLCQTTPSEGQPAWASTYDDAGGLVQRIIPGASGGTVFEPTTRARLQRIWSEKKLPID